MRNTANANERMARKSNMSALERHDSLEDDRPDSEHHERRADHEMPRARVPEGMHVRRADQADERGDEERQAPEDVGGHAAGRRQALDLARELLTLPDCLGDDVEQPCERPADL